MSNRTNSLPERNSSRRAVYRAAKRLLIREARRALRVPKPAIARLVRELLRGKSRTYLIKLLARPAMALAVATFVAACSDGSGSDPIDVSNVVAGEGGLVINGVIEEDRSGFSVSGAGDVNGDGLDDVIIGARRTLYVPDNLLDWQAYVVFGKATSDGPNLGDVAAGVGGFAINGSDILQVARLSVSGAGDVNGDGLADVIIGAKNADSVSGAGQSYVVFGKATTSAVDVTDVIAGNGGFVINGVGRNDQSGWSVSGAGDVNGDGLDDVIVGSYRASPGGNVKAGESYVVFGKADGAAVELSDVVLGSGGFVISGNDTNDYSGFSVSAAGDVNGDGLDDVVIGAKYADPGGNPNAYTGESYVVFGKATTTAVNLSDVISGNGGFVINGADLGHTAGWSVSGAGDVNGDGLDDVVVGAPYAPSGSARFAGQSYVVFGKGDTAAVELADVVSGVGGFVINGIEMYGDGAGRCVSDAGDINGDGFADVIVGARPSDTDGRTNAGEMYVVFGKPDGTAVELSDVAAGTGGFLIDGISDTYDSGSFWNFVSGAGDVNGDGIPDIVIGWDQAEPEGIQRAGQSYVVFGPPLNQKAVFADFTFSGLEHSTAPSPVDSSSEGASTPLPSDKVGVAPGSRSETLTGADSLTKPLDRTDNGPGDGSAIIGQTGARSARTDKVETGFVSVSHTRGK